MSLSNPKAAQAILYHLSFNNCSYRMGSKEFLRDQTMSEQSAKHYLLASDFDQTLSFKDSGVVLSELLGISGFEERVAGLGRTNLVQQGGELAYLDSA